MKRFKNILVVLNQGPYDDMVLDRAVRLSGMNEARVTVRAMVRRPPPAFEQLEKKHGLEEARTNYEARLLERLVETTLRVDNQSKIGSVAAVKEGSFIDILHEVERGRHDLVMIAAEPPASKRDVFLGSTPMHLLRKCPCPVWAFRPRPGRGLEYCCQRILAAVNALAPEPMEHGVNVKILELATSLAKQENAELSVIHCWSAQDEMPEFSPEDIPSAGLDQYTREVRREHRKRFKKLLAPFLADGHNLHSHMVKGDPGLVIPRFAKRRKTDLVVMGTVTRTGIAGLLMGNTAEKALHQIDCSLLAVKPEGFISPVTS